MEAPVPKAAQRLRNAVVCLVLTALVFAQDAGRVVSDTKLDLTVDPVGLLARGLHLWDSEGAAGQLQNQGYGYLFPLGPFHVVLQALGLPDWAVQRLWQSLVLCVALLGVQALAARMRIGTPTTGLLAGVVYALAPRPLSQLGAISIEVWPYALAPWVLVPLVTGTERGSPRRAAALSALAVLLVGGVNAAATLAVVPLGVLYLATRSPGPVRRQLAGWWAVCVTCAVAWWLGPLLLLGRYSPPFLDVIESSTTTTSQTGLWSVLTGNDLWLQYLNLGRPARPAGYLLVTEPALVVCVTALAALGLLGLVRRSLPDRGFLVGGVLLGLLVVGAGHAGDLASPAAGLERTLLDGPLAAFRNVHKYDLLLRLPLVLGLAHLCAEVRLPARPSVRPAAVLTAIALLGAASPALTSLQQPGSYLGIPGYWQETADLLASRGGATSGRALVVPAAPFGEFLWGRPLDEPLQPLARSPWAVRDAVPLGGPGSARVLDTVEEALRSGRGSSHLAAFLRRAGYAHLVVRNDLDASRTGATRPLVVHAALAASPGIEKVAELGPPVGAGFREGSVVVDANLQPTYAAVEVYAVEGGAPLVGTLPREGTAQVSGGPESLLPLLEQGVVGEGTAVRLAGEQRHDPGELRTVTDGYRDREVDVGRTADNASATLGAGTEQRLTRAAHDYLAVPPQGNRVRAALRGIDRARASSAAADASVLLVRGRDHHAAAAFDGDPATTWVSGGVRPVGQWVEASFPRSELGSVTVSAPTVRGAVARPTRVRVVTDAESVDVDLGLDGATTVPLDRPTATVRVTVLSASSPLPVGAVALEVRLGDLVAVRGLRAAPRSAGATGGPPADDRVALAFTAGRRDRPGCLPVGDRPVCAADLPLGDEDDDAVDRAFVLDEETDLVPSVRARARGGAALDAVLQAGQVVRATATSSLVDDPRGRPATVLDRDTRTSWLAAPADRAPALTLQTTVPVQVEGVQLALDRYLAASTPTEVVLVVDGVRSRPLALDGQGRAVLPQPRQGRQLVVELVGVRPRTTVGLDGFAEVLPVGVTELRVLTGGSDVLRQELVGTAPVVLGCGQGPPIQVEGSASVPTRVRTTVGDLVEGRQVVVEPCASTLRLAAGSHHVRVARTAWLQVTDLTLTDPTRPAPSAAADRVEQVLRWDAARRTVRVSPGEPAWLVVREAHNRGWTATLDGRPLVPDRLDGWEQAFALPADGGTVELVFGPDRGYRLALLGGGLLALVLLLLAAVPPRHPVVGLARARDRRRAGPILGAAAAALLAGPAGLAAVLVALLARRLRALEPLVAGGLLGAGAVVALQPWPARTLLETPVQALCLAVVGGLVVSLWPTPPASTPRPARAPSPSSAAPAPPPPSTTTTRRAGSPAPPARPRSRSDR